MISHASQIIKTEAYRPELQFADAVKMLYVYGTKAIIPTRIWTFEYQNEA